MIIIEHRVNKINQIKRINKNHGVEIDIRSNLNHLYLSHDPFKKGISFKKWLKFYKHKILILNVKEEGLEKKILSILKKKNIKSYFFLDQSVPFIIKFMKKGLKKIAVRFSEFEDLSSVLKFRNKVEWVWIDCFKKFMINNKSINILKKNNFKICIVSPELHNANRIKEMNKLKFKIKRLSIKPDAICTKHPNFWLDL